MDSTETRPINKNKSKRYLFNCFKTDDVVDPPPRRNVKTTDPLLSYLALAEKQGHVLPTILSSALTAAKGGTGDGSASRRRKIGKEKSLRIRQALISALSRTSLGRRIINRTKTNKNTRGKSRVNMLGREGGKISNTSAKEVPQGTNSYTNSSYNFSPAFIPSTLSSSTCLSILQGTHVWGSSSDLYRNPPMNGIGVKQEVGESRKKHVGPNMSVCLIFLISLSGLVLLGKFCAILCTSVGFFVVPCCRRKWCNEGYICEESNEFDSAQYKKKLIMEGLSKKECVK